MDKSDFAKVATEIKAELFFQEMEARSHVDPVAEVMLSREPEDPELFKLAGIYCPEAPARFYEKELGGKFKTGGLKWLGRLLSKSKTPGESLARKVEPGLELSPQARRHLSSYHRAPKGETVKEYERMIAKKTEEGRSMANEAARLEARALGKPG